MLELAPDSVATVPFLPEGPAFFCSEFFVGSETELWGELGRTVGKLAFVPIGTVSFEGVVAAQFGLVLGRGSR